MKLVIVAVFVLFAVVVNALPNPVEYTSKYDNIDLDQILKNDRLLNNYVKCLLEKGKCTPDGQELKSKCMLLNSIKIEIDYIN